MVTILPGPTDTHSDVFEKCISNLTEPKRSDFRYNKTVVMDAGKSFITKIKGKKLYTMPQINSIGSIITKNDLLYLYSGKLSKKGQPGREFYDRWRQIPPYELCPLCSVRVATTLDHYLGKAEYPLLSILPLNLIPACKDCNTDKLNQELLSHADETIHPYFDRIDDDFYLHAAVNHTTPASFTFYVDAPLSWDTDLQIRLKNHFRVFNINKLYVTMAAQELSNIRYRLNDLYNKTSAVGVKDFLYEEMETRLQNNKNSWSTAMYIAMYNNDWFHSEGFKF